MVTTTTYKVLCERIKRHVTNGYPSNDFTVSDNEVYLYIFDALSAAIGKLSNEAYAAEGVVSTPEGFITTFKIAMSTATKDIDNGEYHVTMPHPPLNIATGYEAELVSKGQRSIALMQIPFYSRGYAIKMPSPNFGAYCYAEGGRLSIFCPNVDLINSGYKIALTMASAKSENGSENDVINVPPDMLGIVFDSVVQRLLQRAGIPQDLVNDGNNVATTQ